MLARPKHLTWEESACYTLTLATAYRMLFGHEPHELKPGMNVLVWGASGRPRRLRRAALRGGGRQRDRRDFGRDQARLCAGVRGARCHKPQGLRLLGQLPKVGSPEYDNWFKEVRKFGKAIWDITGKGNNVDMVFEHPGESTFPTSTFIVKRGGMVVFCAGTTGFNITFDARYVWMHQKAHSGLAFRQSEAGRQRQPLRHQPSGRPLHVGSFRLRPDPARPYQDVEEPARPPATWRCWLSSPRTGLRTLEDVVEG